MSVERRRATRQSTRCTFGSAVRSSTRTSSITHRRPCASNARSWSHRVTDGPYFIAGIRSFPRHAPNSMHVWCVNPYGPLPGESWREYRTVLAARALVAAGHTVTWWAANFEHRSKQFRASDWETRTPFPGFELVLVPTTSYQRHISMERIRFEQTFARRVAEQPSRARHPSQPSRSDRPPTPGARPTRCRPRPP